MQSYHRAFYSSDYAGYERGHARIRSRSNRTSMRNGFLERGQAWLFQLVNARFVEMGLAAAVRPSLPLLPIPFLSFSPDTPTRSARNTSRPNPSPSTSARSSPAQARSTHTPSASSSSRSTTRSRSPHRTATAHPTRTSSSPTRSSGSPCIAQGL